MTADDVRGELAAALAQEPIDERWALVLALREKLPISVGGDLRERIADALLPVVDRIAGKRAAEAEATLRRVEERVLEFGGDLSEVDPDDLDEPYMWHQGAVSLHGDLARLLWSTR